MEAFDHTAVINMQKVKKINISGGLSLVSYPERGLVGERGDELYVNTTIYSLITLKESCTEIFRNCFVLRLDVATCFIALSELQSLHNNELNRMLV